MNLAVGFFDGLHLGHQKILERADTVLTFRNHPMSVFAPERAPFLLMTESERLSSLEAFVTKASFDGERVVALDFTEGLAAQAPADFADWLERRFPTLQTLLCGPNWTFGKGGKGTADFLRARGLAVETVPYAIEAGEPVSSTRIRAALAAGQLELATTLLGRPWNVTGTVSSGKGLGRTMGCPTINVIWPENLVKPPFGAYVVDTFWGPGVANFGRAPTMGAEAWRQPVLEVHLLENGGLPGKTDLLSVSFLNFLRPERRFASIADLRCQIGKDIEQARACLGRIGGSTI